MLPRVLEPEVMESAEEAHDYDTMDHSQVNRVFVDDLLAAAQTLSLSYGDSHRVFDAGAGTALIPIELVGRGGSFSVVAADAAVEMLQLARQNIARSGMSQQITAAIVDCKKIADADGAYDIVMSNSIIHHIPEPFAVLAELVRILRPGGLLFIRDLFRPETDGDVERLVALYAGGSNPHQQQLFRQSFHAALTVDEVRQLVASLDIPADSVAATSDRHWTLAWRKPAD
jgi:2-polyprenyl-3-methyl-5-hydroxy-6-metoxy-1,4-benzoquinol methylase